MPAVSATTQSSPKPLSLLVLGQGTDPHSERGVECPGDLPAPSDPGLVARARAAKEALGDRVFVLGHHYQRDEVIQFADTTGDSFKLAREAAARRPAQAWRRLRYPRAGQSAVSRAAALRQGPLQARLVRAQVQVIAGQRPAWKRPPAEPDFRRATGCAGTNLKWTSTPP